MLWALPSATDRSSLMPRACSLPKCTLWLKNKKLKSSLLKRRKNWPNSEQRRPQLLNKNSKNSNKSRRRKLNLRKHRRRKGWSRLENSPKNSEKKPQERLSRKKCQSESRVNNKPSKIRTLTRTHM